MRIGFGWDLHTLTVKRPLVLGGVTIPAEKGEAGHSDGDVLIHALIDSLLGALCLDDIGTHFPPSDPQYRNISSLTLLRKTMTLIDEHGYTPHNIDTTVVLQQPKLRPYIQSIRETLASVIQLPVSNISVKAKTKEGVDAAGRGEAIEAYAAVLLIPKDETAK